MKRVTSMPADHMALVYGAGAKPSYDFPPVVLDQLRLARRLWNAIAQRHRDLDERCDAEKKAGGDHKALRKAFVEQYGRPDDAEWAKDYAKAIGLGSAVAAEVMKNVAEANARVIQRRKQGAPAELQVRDFDGTGTTYRQVKVGSSSDVTIEEVESTGRGGLRIERSCKRDHLGRPTDILGDDAVFHFTVYPNTALSVPIPDYFREQRNGKNRIPPGSIVTAVRASRRRNGRHFSVSVSVTYWTPKPAPALDLPPLAMSVGWSKVDGAIRVARVSGVMLPPITPPHDLLTYGWMFPDGNGGYDIEVPKRLLARMDATESIRAFRGQELERVRPMLAQETGRPAWAAAARSYEKVHRAVLGLGLPPEHDLSKWRREDAHHWDYEAGQRAQLLARRDDAWKKVAAWIASQGRPVIVFNKPAVAAIKKKKADDGFAAERGRKNIQQAGPAELVHLVKLACSLRGISVTEEQE